VFSVILHSSVKRQILMMMRIFFLSGFAALMVSAAPAAAQSNERVLTVFGEDKCPADTICVRAPERDRYRIPKELRGPSILPENQSWAARSQATLSEGKSGAGSCSASGAGGWTGCWAEQMRKARAEAKALAAEQRQIP
jgi:hypothetical protein